MQFVIECDHTTFTTIGCLSAFESHQCRYSLIGTFDSIEAAVYPYNSNSDLFSRGKDSGALITSPKAKFTALLASGTGLTDSSDITVMIPHMDCSYVPFLYFMSHHFCPALPAIPMHDPRGRHVI